MGSPHDDHEFTIDENLRLATSCHVCTVASLTSVECLMPQLAHFMHCEISDLRHEFVLTSSSFRRAVVPLRFVLFQLSVNDTELLNLGC